jgi:pilus assembly protein Flp/PilA
MKMVLEMLNNDDGATAIEYGLIAALIAMALISTVSGIGGSLKSIFTKTDSSLRSANSQSQA